MKPGNSENLGAAITALLASSTTLVCCVLPAALVSIGAGAAVVGLVSAVPQLVWLSERKLAVFGIAGGLLVLSGGMLLRARLSPCPIDPDLARRCVQLRAVSAWLYWLSVKLFVLSILVAFVLPALPGSVLGANW